MICDICGADVKNLGVHKYHKHKQEPPEEIKVDVPKEKPLSDLIDGMKVLLRPYHCFLTVRYDEENGKINSVEITARIQIRR